MGEEAATVTQSLLGRRGHGGGGQLQTVSSVTTTLVLSTFVAACISFGFGCVVSRLITIFCGKQNVLLKPIFQLPCISM